MTSLFNILRAALSLACNWRSIVIYGIDETANRQREAIKWTDWERVRQESEEDYQICLELEAARQAHSE